MKKKKKHMENIEDMDISRSIHSGDKFTEFEDMNGKPCCFQDVLRNHTEFCFHSTCITVA